MEFPGLQLIAWDGGWLDAAISRHPCLSFPSFLNVLVTSSFSFLFCVLLSGRCPVCNSTDPQLPHIYRFWWHWDVVLVLGANHSQNLLPSASPSQVRGKDWKGWAGGGHAQSTLTLSKACMVMGHDSREWLFFNIRVCLRLESLFVFSNQVSIKYLWFCNLVCIKLQTVQIWSGWKLGNNFYDALSSFLEHGDLC